VSDPNAAGRFRLASPAIVGILACLVLALVAAGWPLASLAHQSLEANSGGLPWWFVAPFGVVGFVLAWRRPRNPLAWCLVGLAVAGAFSQDGRGLHGPRDRTRASARLLEGGRSRPRGPGRPHAAGEHGRGDHEVPSRSQASTYQGTH
jgi:hypothetical protein